MTVEKITISTSIAAPVDTVWQYWTKPEHIVNWNFASDGWYCPSAENDLQIGGLFKSAMASKDGTMSFDFAGVYDQVALHRIISYSMPDGRQVIILFAEDGQYTRVTESFEPESTNPVEMQRDGWQAILDNFKKYVEQH